jgi:hypothetical protein
MPSFVPSVPITLDKERQLKMDMEVASQAELELGKIYGTRVNLLHFLQEQQSLGITDVAVILWCGLRKADPTLTLSDTLALITLENFGMVVMAIFEAWNLASQPARGEVSGVVNGPFLAPSPGSDSGVSPVSSLASATVSSGI